MTLRRNSDETKRYSEEQIIQILKEAESVPDTRYRLTICRIFHSVLAGFCKNGSLECLARLESV